MKVQRKVIIVFVTSLVASILAGVFIFFTVTQTQENISKLKFISAVPHHRAAGRADRDRGHHEDGRPRVPGAGAGRAVPDRRAGDARDAGEPDDDRPADFLGEFFSGH